MAASAFKGYTCTLLHVQQHKVLTFRHNLLLLDFVFIALIIAEMVQIRGVLQALFYKSRGCAFIFLQHFPVIPHAPVLFSAAYLHS
jgi:hypothetical protein